MKTKIIIGMFVLILLIGCGVEEVTTSSYSMKIDSTKPFKMTGDFDLIIICGSRTIKLESQNETVETTTGEICDKFGLKVE